MSGLSESAKLVKEALEQRGLETPMRPNAVSREEKKEKIEHHMREIL
ncbi:GTP cyclohydrolase, partial [Vibrio parahaemolyticus]